MAMHLAYRKIGRTAYVVALLLPQLLAGCDGGGPPPPMVLNDPSYVPPSFTTVDVCGHAPRMQVVARGTFSGSSGANSGAAGVIVTDDARNNWAVGGDFKVIGPAAKMPDGNWQVTPQPGATPSVGFPCPPPVKMDTTPGPPTAGGGG